ncbi:MAG: hypothetical protein JWO49_2119 [Arthrobacter sp.]|nr:hypothetical protein [Arthrobacter sp.]
MALSDALINLGNQAKELEDSAAGARAESEAKLRARTEELRTSIAEAKSDLDKKVDERSAEISNRWKQMQESVADGFESLRDHAQARRADRAVARAERTAENAEYDAEAAVTFAVFTLQQAEYYVLAAAVARADADAAEAADNR